VTRHLTFLVAVAALALVSTVTHAADPGAKCAAAKQKAAAKKLSGKVKCHGNAIKKEITVDPACLTKAETKFETSFAKAEAKGGCVTTGDVDAIEALIDDTLAQLLDSLPPSTTTTTTTLPPCGISNKCIFVTSTMSTGAMGGVAGADAQCNARAGAAGLVGVYKAWLSTDSSSAVDRMAPGGPYVTPAGDQVADNLADMTDGTLDSPIDDDENGTAVGNREVWTGTLPNGLAAGLDCLDWTSAATTEYASVGNTNYGDYKWTYIYAQFCNRTNVSLYCVQQ